MTDQLEHRGGGWTGTITMDTRAGSAPERRACRAPRRTSAPTSGPIVAHTWGTAEVSLDGQACTGSCADRAYGHSDVGGGSMHQRCDGGAVLAAAMTSEGTAPPWEDGTHIWRTHDRARGAVLPRASASARSRPTMLLTNELVVPPTGDDGGEAP